MRVEQPSRRTHPVVLLLFGLSVILGFSCSRSESFENLMDISVCDPASAEFTLDIDNPYFPLVPGAQTVLEGEGSSGRELVRISVLDETESVAGVETRVVEEYEAIDGRIAEVSRNYFAQTVDGTVCYFGEDVDIYDSDGNVSSHGGAWRADGSSNIPGIFMPAAPEIDQAFQQEIAPGIAEDQAKVVSLGDVTEVPAGTYEDTATLVDRNPLDGSQDEKVYASGIGLIVDGPTRMTEFTPGDA
jgi:hypothetical protein